MSFTPNFTVAQTALNPNIVIVSDTSTGVDAAIAQRRIYFKNSQGEFVVPSNNPVNITYVEWVLASNPITIPSQPGEVFLTKDQALEVRVDWLNAGGTVLYTLTQKYCFSQYNKQFLYYLIQLQSLTFNVIQDTNYWGNVALLWTNIIGAINAVEIADDIYSSQVCLDRATYLASNQEKFF
jgi:hypothetical protein